MVTVSLPLPLALSAQPINVKLPQLPEYTIRAIFLLLPEVVIFVYAEVAVNHPHPSWVPALTQLPVRAGSPIDELKLKAVFVQDPKAPTVIFEPVPVLQSVVGVIALTE